MAEEPLARRNQNNGGIIARNGYKKVQEESFDNLHNQPHRPGLKNIAGVRHQFKDYQGLTSIRLCPTISKVPSTATDLSNCPVYAHSNANHEAQGYYLRAV